VCGGASWWAWALWAILGFDLVDLVVWMLDIVGRRIQGIEMRIRSPMVGVCWSGHCGEHACSLQCELALEGLFARGLQIRKAR